MGLSLKKTEPYVLSAYQERVIRSETMDFYYKTDGLSRKARGVSE